MAEGDPRAGITEAGIDSVQGIEVARKVSCSHAFALALPLLALDPAGWHHSSPGILAQAWRICAPATLSDDNAH